MVRGDAGMAERQVKSRERVADHGEVNAMLDLVQQETERLHAGHEYIIRC